MKSNEPIFVTTGPEPASKSNTVLLLVGLVGCLMLFAFMGFAVFRFGGIASDCPGGTVLRGRELPAGLPRKPQPMTAEIAPAQAWTNLALSRSASVSRQLPDFPARMAVDGTLNDWWSAGAFAPQWIQIDLGANYVVSEIWLSPSQYPEGRTTHRLEVFGPATDFEYCLVHVFEGHTRDSDWLVFSPSEPLQGIRYILIESRSSPSWIGWREIKVISGESGE